MHPRPPNNNNSLLAEDPYNKTARGGGEGSYNETAGGNETEALVIAKVCFSVLCQTQFALHKEHSRFRVFTLHRPTFNTLTISPLLSKTKVTPAVVVEPLAVIVPGNATNATTEGYGNATEPAGGASYNETTQGGGAYTKR